MAGFEVPADTDRQLAGRFGISVMTVRRTLCRLAEEGKLERVHGKGTFVPGGTAAQVTVAGPVQSSAERIASELQRLISEGKLKEGETLPQIKQLSIQYHVNPATVTAAYRILAGRSLVTKTGKYYWVGPFKTVMGTSRPKEVCMCNLAGNDFESLYCTGDRSLAFRKMQRELLRHGYVIRHVVVEDFSGLVNTWILEGYCPEAIILPLTSSWERGLDEQALFDMLKAPLARLCRQAQLSPPAVLIVENSMIRGVPRTYHQFSILGNTTTHLCRTLAQFIAKKSYRNVVFFGHTVQRGPRSLGSLLKIRAELKQIAPSCNFHITYILPDIKSNTPTLEEITGYATDKLRTMLCKYDPRGIEDTRTEVACFSKTEAALQEHYGNSDLWIFSHAALAVEALQWAQAHAVAVPKDLAIISLDDNPVYYHHSITTCVED